jgi:hypothetical protein
MNNLNERHYKKAFSADEAIFRVGGPCCKDCFTQLKNWLRNDDLLS